MDSKKSVVLIQLGSPRSPQVKDVRHYLREFLGDPKVVDFNPFLWKIILYLFILPFRPKKSAEKYARIWKENSFPLLKYTDEFTRELNADAPNLSVKKAYVLSSPRMTEVVTENPDALLVPMFPQYCEGTTGSIKFGLKHQYDDKLLPSFHRSFAFIDSTVNLIAQKLEGEDFDVFLLSFHGFPKRRVLIDKDPYYRQCFETFALLKEKLPKGISSKTKMVFQSRFGSEEWLEPDIEEVSLKLLKEGDKKIAVHCPSFVVDCLETVDEIDYELRELIEKKGGELTYIPCLNTDPTWVKSFAQMLEQVEENVLPESVQYQVSPKEMELMPKQEMKSPPLTTEAKGTLKIIFITLFLDLIGFSIIFPLFPALAKHYLEVDSQNYFLLLIFGSIQELTQVGGGSVSSIVLFGGALGALYSFLQFLAAPIWGVISDRIGRRPVLIISVAGLALSYGLWFFAGSFTLLIFARFIGGIMGGNISTATAVVADVTQKENRAKGMATIGIAFAFGFILGPAMGGLLSMIDLSAMYPALKAMGVNPFSLPALVAMLLSLFNLLYLITRFKETLPEEKRGKGVIDRSFNPLILFRPLPYKGVNLTNFGYFFFLAAFSGMEFTLTFLAAERLQYSPMDNAYMFIFIGFVIALIQGGYVRRAAHKVGEKRMAIQGLILLIPGLLMIGYTSSSWLLYFGLFFLAMGSSMTIPTLTSLVSLYTPAEYQGKSVGIFRSLGALARVVGPIVASLIYWQYGSNYPYYFGAIFLLVPILMVGRLPQVAD